MRAMNREMTLIEWISLHDFGMDRIRRKKMLYMIWAKNEREEKDKIFTNRNKFVQVVKACKQKGLSFLAESYFVSTDGDYVEVGSRYSQNITEDKDTEVSKEMFRKICWFVKHLQKNEHSAFGVTD